MNVDIAGEARQHFEAGQRLYNRRMGQMNLAWRAQGLPVEAPGVRR